jgi:small-conductance mechanosensitive channel
MIRYLLPKLLIFHFMLLANTILAGIIPGFADTTRVTAHSPYEIYDINSEIEKAEKKFNRMNYGLGPDASVQRIDIEFRAYQVTLKKEFQEVSEHKLSHYSKFVLDNTYFIWSDFNMKLQEWQSKINYKIKKNRINLSDLEVMEQRWKLTLEGQNKIVAAEHVSVRIQSVLDEITKLKTSFLEREKELIVLENEIAQESSFCTDIVENVLLLQESLRDSLFYPTSPQLWNAASDTGHFLNFDNSFKTFLHRSSKTIKIYLISESKGLIFALLIFCLLFVYSIKYSFSRYHISNEDVIQKNGIQAILFNYPTLAGFALFFLSYRLFFPYHPLIIGKLTVLFLLIASQFLLQGFHDKGNQGKRFFMGLIIILVLNYLQVMFWYFGYLSRYYILVEQIIGLIISAYYLKPAFWKKVPSQYKLLRFSGYLYINVFVFYLLSLFCNLFGYFDLNILLLKVGIHIPVYTIVFFGIYRIWIALTSATLMVAKNRKQTYLTHYWEKMEMRILQFVRLFLVFFWIYSVIVLFELGAPTYLWMSDFMLKEHTIGNLHISLWAVVAFVLIVLFTFLLTGIIRFVVDDEFISRSKLPKGVLHAISVSIRYIIVFIGIMFALSMAGIDLGKFSLLAGALGVGIGFGLQNIVNNFISGLILIYERPLQVGDTIEIESLMGRVTTIGPRSSHVVTYDGAEVVVPNGNLISNQLINWTLSDNKRRLEVKIGAAYESDPNIVIKILQEVADENQNIFKEPEPLALFDGFGESSLNFRLLFWIPFELGLQAKSDVSVAIYNKFKENNIEIPFPQMDLHVKSKPEDLE